MNSNTLISVARGYLQWLEEDGKSPKTVYTYASRLAILTDYLGELAIEKVTDRHLRTFIDRPRRGGRRPSASTVHGEVSMLRSLFQWAINRGYVTSNPAKLLPSPTVQNQVRKAFDDEVWIEAWTRTDLEDEVRVVLGLGFFCGLRREEMCLLGPHHIDRRNLQIFNFRRKGGVFDALPYGSILKVFRFALPHLVPDDRFVECLHKLAHDRLGETHLLPWGERLNNGLQVPEGMTDPQKINKLFRRHRFPFTPHALRHSFVTNLARCGMDVAMIARMANHTNVTTTMRYMKIGANEIDAWLDTKQHPHSLELRNVRRF